MQALSRQAESKPSYGIALHGGAAESWFGDSDTKRATEQLLAKLALDAEIALKAGARAVDVVTTVTAALEDYPEFNSGKGSVLNIDGHHELEAAIVDGTNHEYRACAGLQRTKNPVKLARAMLPMISPAFLFGPQGDELSESRGLDMVENTYFTTEKRKSWWQSQRAKVKSITEDHGTCGAVALDIHGNVAAANSTGGMTFKSRGRLGDTAVLSAGIYADDQVAIACSGSGEPILKSGVAGRAAAEFRNGRSLTEAVQIASLKSGELYPRSSCGVIGIDAKGHITLQCNSRIFSVASKSSSTELVAGIMGSSYPVLNQHVCYSNDLVRAGLAKYPVLEKQLTIELKDWSSSLTTLARHTFHQYFTSVRRLALAHGQSSGANSVAFVSDGGSRAQLYPISVTNDGPHQSPLESTHAVPSSTKVVRVLNLLPGFVASCEFQGNEPGTLMQIDVGESDRNTHDSILSPMTPDDTYRDAIDATWLAIQLMKNLTGDKQSIKKIEFPLLASTSRSGGRGNVIASIMTARASGMIETVFPAPEPFHTSYPGFLPLGLGKLAADLETMTLNKIATQQYLLETKDVPSNSVPTKQDLDQDRQALMDLQDDIIQAATRYFSHRLGYRARYPSLKSVTTSGGSMMDPLFASFEPIQESLSCSRGLYLLQTSTENKDSTPTSLYAMQTGHLPDVMASVEDMLVHIAKSIQAANPHLFTTTKTSTGPLTSGIQELISWNQVVGPVRMTRTVKNPGSLREASEATEENALSEKQAQKICADKKSLIWICDESQESTTGVDEAGYISSTATLLCSKGALITLQQRRTSSSITVTGDTAIEPAAESLQIHDEELFTGLHFDLRIFLAWLTQS